MFNPTLLGPPQCLQGNSGHASINACVGRDLYTLSISETLVRAVIVSAFACSPCSGTVLEVFITAFTVINISFVGAVELYL